MTSINPDSRYSLLTITLHWLTFILIVGVYAFMELRELFPKGSDPREAMKALHFMLGLTILLLVLPRMATLLLGHTPAILPEPPAWQQLMAKMAHLALYLFMLIMPVLGWLTLSAGGKTIPFYSFELPALIKENKELGKFLKEIHATIGEIGYFLIGLHVIAAFFHHFKQRDNTLTRMLPARKAHSSMSTES